MAISPYQGMLLYEDWVPENLDKLNYFYDNGRLVYRDTKTWSLYCDNTPYYNTPATDGGFASVVATEIDGNEIWNESSEITGFGQGSVDNPPNVSQTIQLDQLLKVRLTLQYLEEVWYHWILMKPILRQISILKEDYIESGETYRYWVLRLDIACCGYQYDNEPSAAEIAEKSRLTLAEFVANADFSDDYYIFKCRERKKGLGNRINFTENPSPDMLQQWDFDDEDYWPKINIPGNYHIIANSMGL